MLRHSVPHFPPSSGGIACCVAELTRFTSTPERRNENINKYFISSSGIEPTTSRFYSHTLRPCAITGRDNKCRRGVGAQACKCKTVRYGIESHFPLTRQNATLIT